ncbi:MAG TPA: ring-cleaving dioxygenase [Anaerolineales bacterium]|nr:ring-cleaving dioxygenase [Anaerolineales bacterium]
MNNQSMSTSVHGIHHVTAIASNAQQNADFYVGLLGLRLVKKSVNQDVIDSYHLFYADEAGTPGTDLTFFIWPDMPPVRLGVGFTVEVSFAIPAGSLGYWQDRLRQAGLELGPLETRFGETTQPFEDPDGLRLALVEIQAERKFHPWSGSPVPAQRQLRGMHAVRLLERDFKPTEVLLTQIMGFESLGAEAGWRRYGVEGGASEGGASGQLVEIQELPGERRGQWGTGGIHHVAWRVKDTPEQMALRQAVIMAGLNPTAQIDRFWFKSVYFKEPGGTLFELATDGPGFDRDEDREHLGETLVLPPWLEAQRAQIEVGLPPLAVPVAAK